MKNHTHPIPLGAALLITVVLLIPAACGTGHGQPSVRIVLITLDTLRFDCLDNGEADVVRMPLVARRAAEGLSFRNFYATTSTTQPTHATLFTGLYPWEHGVTSNAIVLDQDAFTIAERLKEEGFDTVAVVASFPLHRRFGFGQGFDVYVEDFTENRCFTQEWEGIERQSREFYSLSETVTDRALGLLDRTEGDKQFFWFHYFDPHTPYGDVVPNPVNPNDLVSLGKARHPATRRLLKRARRLYDEDVARLDRSLERLLKRLEEDEAAGCRTHIIITSDHGESFGEAGLLGHGTQVTAEQIHVPLVILSPDVQRGVRDQTASSLDIARTILSLADIDEGEMHGRDLTAPPPRSGGSVLGMRRTFAESATDVRLTGKIDRLPEMRFFFAKGRNIYAGNGEEITIERGVLEDEAQRDALRGQFGSLGQKVRSLPVNDSTDPEVREAMEALGYTR